MAWLAGIRFADPLWLLALALAPLLVWLRRKRSIAFWVIPYAGQWARVESLLVARLPIRLVGAGLILLVVALARPQQRMQKLGERSQGYDLMLAVDLSGSMLTEDYQRNGKPINRLEAIKPVLKAFADRRPDDRIGMVIFSGDAYIMSPLTLDHDWLQRNVQLLHTGSWVGDATAIGSALATCANRLRDQPAKSKIIVLLTDGANNAGKITPLAAAEAAHALGIKIYTIGAGSADVAKFPMRDNFGRITYTTIPVDIDNDALQKIADIGGGKFFRAADYNTLKNVYKEINRLEVSKVDVKHFRHVKEYFVWAVYPGLLFLGLEIFLVHTRFRRLP